MAGLTGTTWRFWLIWIVISVAVIFGFWLVGNKHVAERQAATRVAKTIGIAASDDGLPVIMVKNEQVDSSLEFLNWPKNGAATVRFVEEGESNKEETRAFVCLPKTEAKK